MVNPPIMQFHGFWFCVSILDWYTLLVHPLFLVFLQWLYLLTDSILEVRSRCLITNEGFGLSRSTTLNMKPSCFTALYISLLTRNSISWGTIIQYLKFFSMRFILSWLQRGVLKPVCQLWPCCNWFMHMTQATVKGADHNLRGLQQSKGTDGSNLQFTYESVICFSRCCAVTT